MKPLYVFLLPKQVHEIFPAHPLTAFAASYIEIYSAINSPFNEYCKTPPLESFIFCSSDVFLPRFTSLSFCLVTSESIFPL